MPYISIKAQSYLSQIPSHIKLLPYPLTRLDADELETFQTSIGIFKGLKMTDIAFLTKKFDTINLSRGCKLGCLHCSKNALAPMVGNEAAYYEDIKKLSNGFKILSERLGFDVLNGNKHINIVEDSNPFDIRLKGRKREHSLIEAMNIIYNNLKIPLVVRTSILADKKNKCLSLAYPSARSLVTRAKEKPEQFEDIQISFNPFVNNNFYAMRMAETLKIFLDLFKIGKARLVTQYAPEHFDNYNKAAVQTLYKTVFSLLQKMTNSSLESIPELNPSTVTRNSALNEIKPIGRAKRFFGEHFNGKISRDLNNENEMFKLKTEVEQRKFLLDRAAKKIDIDGTVYTTRLVKSGYTNLTVEVSEPTNIRLNYINNIKPNKVYNPNDINQSNYFK